MIANMHYFVNKKRLSCVDLLSLLILNCKVNCLFFFALIAACTIGKLGPIKTKMTYLNIYSYIFSNFDFI